MPTDLNDAGRRARGRDSRALLLAVVAVTAFAILTIILAAGDARAATGTAVSASALYGYSLPDLDGKPVPLSTYQGKVLLLVNTASKCGFTPQYEALEALYRAYRERGLVVLGFPANNFRGQEPGSNAQIREFCSTKFKVDFPMFGKISVKGDDIHPLYKWLTEKDTDPGFAGDIQWNFTKFLVDRKGNVIARFPSATTPDSPEVKAAIEKALAAA